MNTNTSLKKQFGLLIDIFWSFFKISPITFGGGYAMLPALEREVVERRGWIKEHEMSDVLSIAGTAPGGIGVNAATFIGYRVLGIKGAIAAVAGVMLPTSLIILVLCITLASFQGNPKVDAAFKGIRVSIIALIVYASYKIARTAVFDKATLATVIGTVLVLLFLDLHPMFVIVGGAAAGIAIIKIKEKLGMLVRLEKEEEASASPVKYKYPDYFLGDGI